VLGLTYAKDVDDHLHNLELVAQLISVKFMKRGSIVANTILFSTNGGTYLYYAGGILENGGIFAVNSKWSRRTTNFIFIALDSDRGY
jgi:hypothetical protein